SQAAAPTSATTAATRNPVPHPETLARNGVRERVMAPPTWLAVFMNPDTEPEDFPPRSAVSAQNEPCARYRDPAPPASTKLATRASWAADPARTNSAVSTKPATGAAQRPMRGPSRRVIQSETAPPAGLQTAMARKGRVA